MEWTDHYTYATRVIRCRKTRRYFTGSGWTKNPTEARPFPDEIEAARACTAHQLFEVDLVLLTATRGNELFATQLR